MQISLDTSTGAYQITAYGDGYIAVNERRLEASIVISAENLDTAWQPQRVADLTKSHIGELAALDAEIVIIGTGSVQHFPPTETLTPLLEHKTGFEIMDTRAACRTYNILMSEGRNVVAALMMILP